MNMFGGLTDEQKEICRQRLNDIITLMEIVSPDLCKDKLTRMDDTSDPEQEMYRWGYHDIVNNAEVTITVAHISYNSYTGSTSLQWTFCIAKKNSHLYYLTINVHGEKEVFTHIQYGENFDNDNVGAMFECFNNDSDLGKIIMVLTGGINTIVDKYKNLLKG